MKTSQAIIPLLLLSFSACAERPAYFGRDARVLLENGANYWEASANEPPYLQVRLRRRIIPGNPASEATEYAGTLSLGSIAPVVMRSAFTLSEGASETFHYAFNSSSAQSGQSSNYFPDAVDVVVTCGKGRCRADSKPLKISPDGRIALKSRRLRNEARAAASASEALKKDNECAILHDSLRSLHDHDASIRAFTAKYGEAETRAMAKRVQGNYEAKACAAWLDGHGGVGAAWRRVRVAQWTSFAKRKD
jgi:hypothetical protein